MGFLSEHYASLIDVRQGDARKVLRAMKANSVHCVVTSPPYWGLRDYGIPSSIWGGDPKCRHSWGEKQPLNNGSGLHRRQPNKTGGQKDYSSIGEHRGQFCRHCGAWFGTLGLEPTIGLWVRNAVEVFREVRRVLRPDGTLWLNLGDSYAGTPNGRSAADIKALGKDDRTFRDKPFSTVQGVLKSKDLCGQPWRLAFALQEDGWYLRQDIIWSKPNPMPESTKDRCTKAHEYLFLLTKSARYYYDAEAIREEAQYGYREHTGEMRSVAQDGRRHTTGTTKGGDPSTGRNKRSVWQIPIFPFPEAHFATFPPKLVEPCIKAGTSEKGCCTKCGAPWKRKIEREVNTNGSGREHIAGGDHTIGQGWEGTPRATVATKTVGWKPTCKCNAGKTQCTVLDPFFGSGTTAIVTRKLGRLCIGVEMGKKYVKMAKRRLDLPAD